MHGFDFCAIYVAPTITMRYTHSKLTSKVVAVGKTGNH